MGRRQECHVLGLLFLFLVVSSHCLASGSVVRSQVTSLAAARLLGSLSSAMEPRASPELSTMFEHSLPRSLDDEAYWRENSAAFDDHLQNFVDEQFNGGSGAVVLLDTGNGELESVRFDCANCANSRFPRVCAASCKAKNAAVNTFNAGVDSVGRAGDWAASKVSDAADWIDEKAAKLINADELRSAMDSVHKITEILVGGGNNRLSVMDVMIAVLFGVFNGFTMGLGDNLRNDFRAIREDPVCTEAFGRVKQGFIGTMGSLFSLLKGVVSRKARIQPDGSHMSATDWIKNNVDQAVNSLKTFAVALWDLITKCNPLKKILFMLAFMLVVCLLFTLVLWAFPGVGWIAYIVGVVMTVVFGVPFLWKTIKKLARAISTVTKGYNKQAVIDIIEAGAEIVGFIATVLLTSGAMKLFSKVGRAQIMNKLSKVEMLKMFKGTFKPSPAAVEMAQKFGLMTKAAETGTDAAKSAEMARFAKQEPPLEAEAAAANTENAAAKAENAAAKSENAGQIRDNKRTDQAAQGTVTAADEAASKFRGAGEVVTKDQELAQLRLKNRKGWLGDTEKVNAALAENGGRLSAAQIAEDAKAVAAGKPPSWAGPEPMGIRGSGPPSQQQYWDKVRQVWRNGPNSFDPLTGENLSGKVVELSGYSGEPRVDVCKINPNFCRGVAPSFCVQAPELCLSLEGKKIPGLEGMPRSRMPQANMGADNQGEKFLEFLGKDRPAGKPGKVLKEFHPSELTPTQGEIGIKAVESKGDKIIATDPDRIIWVSKDKYIIDGHHGWAGAKWANEMGHSGVRVKAFQVDMTIEEIIKRSLTALEYASDGKIVKTTIPIVDGPKAGMMDTVMKSKFPDMITFQNLLGTRSIFENDGEHYKHIRSGSYSEQVCRFVRNLHRRRLEEQPDLPFRLNEC